MSNHPRYILGKRVARGGMAEIFLGKAVGSDNFQKLCAVKKILPHYAQDREYIEMFRGEADICKRLQHANIVQVYDFKRVDDSYAIIMEFVDGADLRSLLAACEKLKARLNVPMAVYLASQAARGLHYAHTKVDEMSGKRLDIVHRDISPQNILVSFEGEIKVIDFGIAKFESRHQETKPGVVKGKYSYMSPEQVSAKPLDARTDIFSLGIVLWETLAMKRLFAAETEVETIKNVQGCVIRKPLTELNALVDPELHEIILRAVAKDKRKRFDSAGAFEKELIRYLNRRYPEFTPGDLGTFVKQIFVQKRAETQRYIQELLSDDSNSNALNSSAPKDAVKPSEPASKTQEAEARLADILAANDAKNLGGTRGEDSKRQPSVEIRLDIANVESLPLAVGYKGGTSISPGANRAPGHTTPPTSVHPSTSNDQNPRAPVAAARGGLTGYSQQPERPRQTLRQKSKPMWSVATTDSGGWSPRANNNLLIYAGSAAAALLLSLVLILSFRGNTAGKGNMQILLASKPSSVMISIDGKLIDEGNYLDTPRRFSLPPGKHEMTVSRHNYLPQKIEVTGKGGDLFRADRIVLKRNTSLQLANVNIRSDDNRPVYVIVNNGQTRGPAPLRTYDLEWGKAHSVLLYPNYPEKRGGFKCTFTPAMRPPTKPYTLLIQLPRPGRAARCVAN